MSEEVESSQMETQDGQQTQGVDKIGELESKFSSIAEQLEAFNQQQQQFQESVVNSLSQSRAQAQPAQEEDYDIYDGKKFAERVKQETLQTTQQLIQQQMQKQTQLNNKILELNTDYPEISQAGSELQKAFINTHNSLPKHLQETPEGYELAAMKAVNKLGVAPKSRRQAAQSEDFSVSSSSSAKPKAASNKKGKAPSDITKAWSQLFGRDVESPDYNKRIESALNRKSWTRWE